MRPAPLPPVAAGRYTVQSQPCLPTCSLGLTGTAKVEQLFHRAISRSYSQAFAAGLNGAYLHSTIPLFALDIDTRLIGTAGFAPWRPFVRHPERRSDMRGVTELPRCPMPRNSQ